MVLTSNICILIMAVSMQPANIRNSITDIISYHAIESGQVLLCLFGLKCNSSGGMYLCPTLVSLKLMVRVYCSNFSRLYLQTFDFLFRLFLCNIPCFRASLKAGGYHSHGRSHTAVSGAIECGQMLLCLLDYKYVY